MKKTTEISPLRKIMYYGGMILGVIGMILFFSTFLAFFNMDPFASSLESVMIRPVIGIVLTIVGSLINQVGRAGFAGSGVVLNPTQARKDLEPYSRQFGGMISDGLEEINRTESTNETIKVRCKSCQALNDEKAKFCQECGQPL